MKERNLGEYSFSSYIKPRVSSLLDWTTWTCCFYRLQWLNIRNFLWLNLVRLAHAWYNNFNSEALLSVKTKSAMQQFTHYFAVILISLLLKGKIVGDRTSLWCAKSSVTQWNSAPLLFLFSCIRLKFSLGSEARIMVLLRQQREHKWTWKTPTWKMSFLEPRETLINVNGETSFKTQLST